VREWNFVRLLCEVSFFESSFCYQAFAVHEEAPLHCFGVRKPKLFLQTHRHELAYSHAGFARAVKQKSLLALMVKKETSVSYGQSGRRNVVIGKYVPTA
tara:strand:+ start:958 stop:1254 length:297 start_codon:yes stop_codon:yes gene_type:complete